MPMQTKIGKTTLRLVTGDIADQDTDAVVTARALMARFTPRADRGFTRSADASEVVPSATRS